MFLLKHICFKIRAYKWNCSAVAATYTSLKSVIINNLFLRAARWWLDHFWENIYKISYKLQMDCNLRHWGCCSSLFALIRRLLSALHLLSSAGLSSADEAGRLLTAGASGVWVSWVTTNSTNQPLHHQQSSGSSCLVQCANGISCTDPQIWVTGFHQLSRSSEVHLRCSASI